MKNRDIQRLLGLAVGYKTQRRSLREMGPLSGHVRDGNGVPESTRLSQQ
jgi:hypothetical protein